ncbi:uncharacterized protein yc1106_09874 [Curvularia clavata]|uniref:Uncharacterized protein n=1 Tax=Curvularia clavata TaxID=95742 RepID=A0A9Q9DY39_CURCL|nr:uncharacterized protein yc1106_09874 [Curvularia clavata]
MRKNTLFQAKCATMDTHVDRSVDNDSDLSSLSSSTHTSPMSKEDSSLREVTDARLVQALNYMNDEGGDDSPATYIKRVKRIDNDLVQRLFFEKGGDYDKILHQQLQAVVRKEMGVFSQAVYNDPPESDDSVSETEDEVSPASVTPALYRRDEELDGPVSSLPTKGKIDYQNLTLADIKARLQLPTLPEEVEKEIKQWCTAEQIEKVVEEFKRSDEGEKLSKNHTLGAFLDKLMLEKQGDLTDIRHAVNASPTKSRASSVRSSSHYAKSTIHAAREQALKAALDTSTGGKPSVRKSLSNATAPSPVARKINRSRAISLKNSPRRQSGVSTVLPSAETTPTEAAVLQQGLDGNRASNTSVDVDSPRPSSSKKTKRKRSIGEQPYTPEKKHKKSAAPSSLKKPGGAPIQTPGRSVRFMSEDSDDMSSDSSIAIRGSKPKKVGSKRTPKSAAKASSKPKTKLAGISANGKSKASPSKRTATNRSSLLPVRDTPAKPAKKSSLIPTKLIKITEKDSKATAAGKAVRNSFVKKPVEKGGAEEAAETRSTRSGARSRK